CTLLRQGFYPMGREGWYRDEARSGGIFLDLMIHDIDWALCQFGPAARVYARLVHSEGVDGASPYVQGMATVRHRSGVISGITGAWGYPGPFTTAVEIAGDGGLLRYHSDESRPVRLLTAARDTHATATGAPLPDLDVEDDPYRAELAHFVDVLQGRAEPLVRPEESLAALEVAVAARMAATTNSVRTFQEEEHA
ncbi:MAG: gfo/Idh/MocA family oxidoreductase, partial [Chloroflexi bacterium]|nr:gfo/Idh/MocA family oxidoreductase [Chloroflexota bacterium]